jgi:hypothetical protein
MFIAVFSLGRGLATAGVPVIVSLIAQIATGAIVYIASAFVLVRPSATELLRLGREAISRRRG